MVICSYCVRTLESNFIMYALFSTQVLQGYLCYSNFKKKTYNLVLFFMFLMDELLISFFLKTGAFHFADKKMIAVT